VRVPFQEEYVTVSRKGVLRGLHFQVPPAALEKIVLCVHGAVLDAVVDLRVGSPTYKKHVLLELQGSGGEMIFVPKGCAHGFYALTDPAILIYKTSHVFRPECDKGIHWASAGIAWPEGSPVISGRDRVLPELAAFQSPFTYAGDS
jgi:dTDP-4-dehydrorhamnose 3,5-epimerase